MSAPDSNDRNLKAVRHVLCESHAYVDHPAFHAPDAEQVLFGDGGVDDVPGAGQRLLDAESERSLFLQLNYCRWRAAELCRSLRRGCGAADSRALLRWREGGLTRRSRLVEKNLALAPAMVRRVCAHPTDQDDLISEGHMALLRAVDRFDAGRGLRFSSYACKAILRSARKYAQARLRQRTQCSILMQDTPATPCDRPSDHLMDALEESHQLRRLLDAGDAGLTNNERRVLNERFPLAARPLEAPSSQPLALAKIGRRLGLTTERISQIERSALNKLRRALDPAGMFPDAAPALATLLTSW